MTSPTQADEQVTQAVTQADEKVQGEAPEVALGHIFQTMEHSTGLGFQNAVTAQQRLNAAAQEATTQGVSLLYALDTAAEGVATSEVGMSDLPTALASLNAALKAPK